MMKPDDERVAELRLTRKEWNALISAASIGAMGLRGERVPLAWMTVARRHIADVDHWNQLMKRIETIGRATFPEIHHDPSGPRPP